MEEIRFDKNTRVAFTRETLAAGGHVYRATFAYEVVGVVKDGNDRDPAFNIRVGMSFCNILADNFVKSEGRADALERLHLEPLYTRVYVDQPVLTAILRALGRASYSDLQKFHVPSRLARVLRKSVTVATPEVRPPSPRRAGRRKRSAVARSAYAAAMEKGLTKSQAIAAASQAMVELDR